MVFQIKHGFFKFNFTDHHAVLGIPVDADAKQVRKRYIKIAQRLHPDTCKAKNDVEKQQANQILSKLVNPAYEQLYKDKSRVEYQLVLSQMGKRLVSEGGKITLASEAAKKLYRAGADLDVVYHKLLQALAADQYKSLEQVLNKVAQISELNLVYLIRKQSQEIKRKRKPPETTTEMKGPTVASYVRRAQEYFDKNNFAKTILELRHALELDRNNSTCNGLMGLAYLKQNNLGMARVYINKACKSNPKDPIAIQGKQELDKVAPKAENKTRHDSRRSKDKSSKQSESRKGGFLGSLFGSKKK
ncbi:MAG: DnaJ domain-containing protein [Xenococcaceae cyanobacterium]